MTPVLHIAVAGCGPAGLAAALLLHRDGHRVTLFERFDTPRPIGSGLMIQPTGQAVLAAVGLGDALADAGVRIDRLFGMAGRRVVLDMRYAALAGGRHGIALHRAALFALLHDAVAAAVIPIRTANDVIGSEITGPRRVLKLRDRPDSPAFDLVIDALGSRSPLASATGRALAYGALWATVPWAAGFSGDALEQRYRAASVMAGVLPVGTPPGFTTPQATLFWSLRADRLDAWRAAGLDAWKAQVRALWPPTAPLLDAIVDADQLTFARYAHRTLSSPTQPALAHIGDAWHSTSPQLGQGANMALLDAWALAKAVRESDGVPAALDRFRALRQRHIRLYQGLSRLLTPVYQSDGRVIPWLRDWAVGPLSRSWPVPQLQGALVSGLVGDPLGRLGLA